EDAIPVVPLGLDYAGGRPGGAAIKQAGYDFVVRYLSDGGPGLPGKLLTPSEADDLRANSVDIVSNWETTADRALAGHDAGVADAQAALAQVLACGGRRDRPIYFSVDFDAAESQQVAINDYLFGAGTVLPGYVGVYGGYWVVSRALDAGAATWGWQTVAWSGSNIEPRRNLYQRAGTVTVNGVDCDVNEAHTTDYGQWSYQSDQVVWQRIWTELTGEEDTMATADDVEAQLVDPNSQITLYDGASKATGQSFDAWQSGSVREWLSRLCWDLLRFEPAADVGREGSPAEGVRMGLRDAVSRILFEATLWLPRVSYKAAKADSGKQTVLGHAINASSFGAFNAEVLARIATKLGVDISDLTS